MNKILLLTIVFTLLLTAGNSLRAADAVPDPDAVELAAYADKLREQGMKGARFNLWLDQRFNQIQARPGRAPDAVPKVVTPPLAPGSTPAPTLPLKPTGKKATPVVPLPAPDGTKPAAAGAKGGESLGMGGFVQQMHAQGLSGRALADAIHTELRRRGVGQGHGKPGGPDDGKVGPSKGTPDAPTVSETPAKSPAGKPTAPGKSKGKGKG